MQGAVFDREQTIMDKVVAIIQARMSSSRLPRKIALDIYGKSLLERVINQVKRAKYVNSIVVATSIEREDNITEMICRRLNINCFRGSLDDVRSRFLEVAKQQSASIIVRITADNPLTEPYYIDLLISKIKEYSNIEYCIMNKEYIPDGTMSEVFRINALLNSVAYDDSEYSREHVTPGIKEMYQVHTFKPDEAYRLNNFFVGVDTFEDYLKINEIFSKYQGTNDLLKQLITDIKLERQSGIMAIGRNATANAATEVQLIHNIQ
jgi:spore coat polysaccharide biosynthesis protein SpsF